jgi:hypothetical protein
LLQKQNPAKYKEYIKNLWTKYSIMENLVWRLEKYES